MCKDSPSFPAGAELKRPLRCADENGVSGGRKVRHQRPIQLEILYYPQAVARQSGATGTIPYSQYYFHNHEEDNDNFAGAGAHSVTVTSEYRVARLAGSAGSAVSAS